MIKKNGKKNTLTLIQPLTFINILIKSFYRNEYVLSYLILSYLQSKPVRIIAERIFGKNLTRILLAFSLQNLQGLFEIALPDIGAKKLMSGQGFSLAKYKPQPSSVGQGFSLAKCKPEGLPKNISLQRRDLSRL